MREEILEGNLKKTIVKLTIPSYFGMLGMNIFNIIDTFFVSIIGSYELAAMSFTFSVVMIVNLITVGIGIGIGTLVSKAVGNADKDEVVHIIMTGLFMSFGLAIVISIIGLLTIDPFFSWLGANEITLPLVKEYMVPWYIGCTFLFLSMVVSQIFRGLGDPKIPGRVMVESALINTILDPILIFGFFFFPNWGMFGASVATVISRAFTFFVLMYHLNFKYNAVKFKGLNGEKIKRCAKNIFAIGFPNSITKVVNPLVVTCVTAILANQSQMSVAGFGVAIKIEAVIYALAIAFSNTSMAVLGQNLGAGNKGRVKEALGVLNKMTITLFAFIYLILFISAPTLARIFTHNEEAVNIVITYLRILPFTYGLQSIFLISTAFYNVLGRPFIATILTFSQFVLIILPFANVTFSKFGAAGLFTLMATGLALISLTSLTINKRLI